ncbi:MAG: hypothetical protein ACYCZX_00845 [Rhodospirillaceae bacterium]
MSLAEILNLSQPRLVAAVVVASVAVAGISVQSLLYQPKVFDACAGVAMTAAVIEEAPFDEVAELYLRKTRGWSQGDYCIDKKWIKGNERIVSVLRRGMLVGGGEGFQLRIDPAGMTVKGELAHE